MDDPPLFFTWLYPANNPTNAVLIHDNVDLTKGLLYPYLQAKAIYLCPSETGLVPGTSLLIDHSYQMQCMMCHVHNTFAPLAPSRSVYFVEVVNQTRSFVTGIAAAPNPLQMAFRHNQREHFVMLDTHVESLSRTEYTNAATDERFWYPTKATDRSGNP